MQIDTVAFRVSQTEDFDTVEINFIDEHDKNHLIILGDHEHPTTDGLIIKAHDAMILKLNTWIGQLEQSRAEHIAKLEKSGGRYE